MIRLVVAQTAVAKIEGRELEEKREREREREARCRTLVVERGTVKNMSRSQPQAAGGATGERNHSVGDRGNVSVSRNPGASPYTCTSIYTIPMYRRSRVLMIKNLSRYGTEGKECDR